MLLFNRLFSNSNKAFIQDINKAIEFNPYCAEDYVNRGDLKCELKKYRSAIQDYNVAIDLNPKYAIAYYNRGNAKYFIGDNEGANQDWRNAVEFGLTYFFRNINMIYKYNHSKLSFLQMQSK